MRRLKVLISAYACNPDEFSQMYPGEDETGWRLMDQLSRFHDVRVITDISNKKGIEKDLVQRDLVKVNFYYLQLPSLLRMLQKVEFGKRIYYYLWQIKALKVSLRLHRQFHFDLANHITFGNDWIPTFIGAFLPAPFIWGPLGGGQKTPKGLLQEYSVYGKLAEGVRSAAQWLGRHDFFRRRCLKRAKAILVCNRETREKIPRKYAGKIHLFPVNGISLEDTKANTSERNSDRVFRVLTAGRFHRLKGFALAIKSFGIFSKKFPNSEFVLIGKGSEEKCLKRLIHNLGLESKVLNYTWMRREELLVQMRSSDVVLFPSFRDGGGAVVVEAMSCGKPVVCLDTGGPGFHIKEEWGIKISPKNSEYVVRKMAKALEELYLNKELKIKMGVAARKRAEEFYLWDRLGERLQEIYQQALPNIETNRTDRI